MAVVTPFLDWTAEDEPYLLMQFLHINVTQTDEIRTILRPYTKTHECLLIYGRPEPLIGGPMSDDTVYFSASFENVSIDIADEIRTLMLPYLKILTGNIYYNTLPKD